MVIGIGKGVEVVGERVTEVTEFICRGGGEVGCGISMESLKGIKT